MLTRLHVKSLGCRVSDTNILLLDTSQNAVRISQMFSYEWWGFVYPAPHVDASTRGCATSCRLMSTKDQLNKNNILRICMHA